MSTKITLLTLILLVCAVLTGCVERKLTINTTPAGAEVFLNDEQIGISPVTVSFSWYGDYKVKVSKQGYQTLDTHRNLKAPLRDYFPLDLFAEVLWPGNIVDDYDWSFELKPYQAPTREQMLDAAESMRQEAIFELQ